MDMALSRTFAPKSEAMPSKHRAPSGAGGPAKPLAIGGGTKGTAMDDLVKAGLRVKAGKLAKMRTAERGPGPAVVFKAPLSSHELAILAAEQARKHQEDLERLAKRQAEEEENFTFGFVNFMHQTEDFASWLRDVSADEQQGERFYTFINELAYGFLVNGTNVELEFYNFQWLRIPLKTRSLHVQVLVSGAVLDNIGFLYHDHGGTSHGHSHTSSPSHFKPDLPHTATGSVHYKYEDLQRHPYARLLHAEAMNAMNVLAGGNHYQDRGPRIPASPTESVKVGIDRNGAIVRRNVPRP